MVFIFYKKISSSLFYDIHEPKYIGLHDIHVFILCLILFSFIPEFLFYYTGNIDILRSVNG